MLLSRRFSLGVLGSALVVLAGCAQQNPAPVNTGPSNVTTRQRAALTGDVAKAKPTVSAQPTNKDDLRKILADQIRKAAAEKGTNTQHKATQTQQTPTNKKPQPKGEVTRNTNAKTSTTGKNNSSTRAKIKPAEQVVSSGRTSGNSTPTGTPRQ